MGFFSGLTSALTGGLSNVFKGGNDSADFLDPLNVFHQGRAERTANQQWNLEYDLAKKNYDQEVKAFEYQKALNEQMREDSLNAVQNRVADLKNAGLSPTLAAGSAASVPALHAGTAPQMKAPGDSKVQAAMFKEGMIKDTMQLATSLMGNFANVSRTKAESALLRAKGEEQDIINKYLEDYLRGRNLGQNLSNDAQSIANRFAEQLNQAKIDSMKKNLDLMQSEIDKNNAVKELTKTKRFTEIQQQILNGLRQSKLSAEISDEYLKMMSMAYSLQWYQKHDLPYGSASNNSLLLMGLDKALKFVEEGGLTDSYGIDRDDANSGLNLKNLRNEDGSLKGLKDSIFGQLFGLQ